MYRLKKFFITTKQTLIKDAAKEWNMEWLAERINLRMYLLMYLYDLVVVLV